MASSDLEMTALADYKSSLNDLDCNSKPLINVLTMLAEENQHFASGIVDIIRERILESVMKIKLPSLYLLDSILKNVGGDFLEIISKHMIGIFTNVFEKGDERIRMSLFKLRNTWPQYFPTAFLHQLDVAVREMDPNWPVVEIPPPSGSIHINPKFLLKEHVDSKAPEDASAPSKLQQQKEQLLAEEQRIQDQLKKLQEDQQRRVVSKEEEEKQAREKYLKQQQMEREMMIREQQKQILALKKLQKEQEANFPTTIKNNTLMMVRAKQSDPRLLKEDSKFEKLGAQVLELQGEKGDSEEDRDKPKKTEMKMPVKDQENFNEKCEEEPNAKKRKANNHLTETYNDEKQPGMLDKIDRAVGHDDRGLSDIATPITNMESQKYESAETVTVKKRTETVCGSAENGNELQSKNRQIAASEVADKRGRKPPWRRLVEQPDRRNLGSFRGRNNENERTSRENKRMDFYPTRRQRFRGTTSGSSAGLSRRAVNRERFASGRHGARETFGIPQRAPNRHVNEMMHKDERFGVGRTFYENETYHHNRDFYESRTDQPDWAHEGEVGAFEYNPRTSNQDHFRVHFHNQRDIPYSEDEPFHSSYMGYPSNDRFLKKDDGGRPFDKRNISHDSDHFPDRIRLVNEGLSHHNQPYMPHFAENEDRFRQDYQNSDTLHFGEHLPPNSVLEVVDDARQKSYNVDHLTDKTETFLQRGNVDDAYEPVVNRITVNAAHSSNTDSVLEMIKNIKRSNESASKKDKSLSDIESGQSQPQEQTSGIKKLFEGLVSAGVLPTSMFSSESAPSPPPNIETSENDIPSIGFVMEQLKIRHDSVINTLYSGMQCGTCGLRFNQEDKNFYGDHLDWHFRNNRIGRDGKRSASRPWFHFKETWMDMDDSTDVEEKVKSAVFELERKIQDPAASESNTSCSVLREDEVCNICFEPFEQFWDESLEEWRYNNATRINGLAYHVHCYDDIKTGSDSEQEILLDEMSTEVGDDSLYKENKDLPATCIDVYAENNQLNEMNVHAGDNSEISNTSRNDQFIVEDIAVAQESIETCRTESPRPLNLLCNVNNVKGEDENEIT